MTTHRRILPISPTRCDHLDACCAEGYQGPDGDGYDFDQEVTFSDGMRLAIQVCRCRGEPSFIQAVLFTPEGGEVACSHEAADTIVGEWELECDSTTYICAVVRRVGRARRAA